MIPGTEVIDRARELRAAGLSFTKVGETLGVDRMSQDAARKGRMPRTGGEHHPAARYSDAVIAEVRRLRDAGFEFQHISALTGVEASYACRIANRKVRA